MLGKGRAEALTDADYAALADKIGCHPAVLEAIAVVESGGFGWFPDGRMKILFEKHWFYKLVDESKRAAAVRAGLARKAWISPAKGGYREQGSADARYGILARAIALDEEAAFRSISMGRFQIMGFNYAMCGFVSAKHMWTQFLDGEKRQMEALVKFMTNKGLLDALGRRDFAKIEQVYNGGGLNGAYATKMGDAYERLMRGKWRTYIPGRAIPADVPAPAPIPTAPPSPPASRPRHWLVVILSAIVAFFYRRNKP
jgi:hypothetical protein